MNDYHLIPSTDVTGKPVETIVPGVRPDEKPKKQPKQDDK